MKLLRGAFAQGCRRGEDIEKECLAKLRSIAKRINEKKIAGIIKRAEALIEARLAGDPRVIVLMLQKLLKNVAEHTDVEVTAHPLDAIIIRSSLNELAIAHTSARKVMLLEDMGFQRGSLLIKANKSIIDAHIKTELDQARDLLLGHTETDHGRAH